MGILDKIAQKKMDLIQKFNHPNYTTIHGIKIKLDYTRKYNAYVYSAHRYETKALEKFSSNIDIGNIVFDCGADQGLYALIASKQSGDSGKILAFEPIENRREKLNENIELNGFSNITVLPYLISDSNKRIQFSDEDTRISHENNSKNAIFYDSVTLDQISEKYGFPDVIKLDIEGAERLAFDGMDTTLERKPKIFLEIHSFCPNGIKDIFEIFQILQKKNYNMVDLTKGEKITDISQETIQKLFKNKNENPHIYAESQ